MYVAAQKVVRPAAQRSGINVYLYRHGPRPPPGVSWENPDVELIATEFPGELASAAIEVPAGGNPVRSYLDVVCSDDTPAGRVIEAIRQFQGLWEIPRGAVPVRIDRVAIRFACEPRLQRDAAAELRELSGRAARLIESPVPLRRDVPPIEIRAEIQADRMVLHAPEASLARLREVNGPQWRPTSLTLDRDVRGQLVERWGEPYEHLAPVLTGRSLDDLLELGGVRVVRADTGELLWKWPRRDIRPSYCLACHQHNTLVPEPRRAIWRCTFCDSEQPDDGLWIAALA